MRDRAFSLIYKTEIQIPDSFKQTGLKTKIVVTLDILENGLISAISVIESTGYPVLDQAIITQVRNWKFNEEPGLTTLKAVLPIVISY